MFPMADSPAKRAREAKKRQWREDKAERKRLRKAGLLGVAESDNQPSLDAPSAADAPTTPEPHPNV